MADQGAVRGEGRVMPERPPIEPLYAEVEAARMIESLDG